MQACFKQGFNEEYAINTTPASNWYNGDPSGLRVWDIGPAINIMNYKLGAGTAGPSLHLVYNSISGDNNANGFIEPAESANILVDASNFGQLSSGTAIVTCTAVGANAGFVTVNTSPINVGVINPSQSIPTLFNFSVAPGTPLGTAVSLQFTINDGAFSTYITRQIMVGVILPIHTNSTIQYCSALFYDEGIESNYSNNTDYTTVFSPVNAGDAVRLDFTEFELEDFTNCGYDYLKIYNGPSTASTLIGTYCGINSPGQVTSTDVSGALTFEFHADEGVTALGWKAVLSCVAGVSLSEHSLANSIRIFPNPSVGLVNLNVASDEEVLVSVFDVTGREVLATTHQGQKNIQLDLSDKTNGLYFITVRSGKESYTTKMVLNR